MVKIKIVSPSDGQTILGDKVTISYIVSDFTVGQDGYINLWLDNPIEEASLAAKITGQFDYTLSDLTPGDHKITLEAKRKNSRLFTPPVKETVSFTTLLPQIVTFTPSPAPFKIPAFAGFINWQYVLIIVSLVIIIAGIFIKFTFGRPKIW